MLKTVNLPSLLGVTGDFVVNSSVIEKISIPKVEFIGEDMYITSDALLDLDANAVESVGASLIVKGSVAQKESATTEAIVFSALKQVGNELTIQYFPNCKEFIYRHWKVWPVLPHSPICPPSEVLQ